MYVGFGSYGQDTESSTTSSVVVPVLLFGGMLLIALIAARGDVDHCERLWKQFRRASLEKDKYLADYSLVTAKHDGCRWTRLPGGA